MKIIIKFLNGDITLGKTVFWGMAMVIILSTILAGAAMGLQFKGVARDYIPALPGLLWFFAIWRSAGKHQGKKFWAYLTRTLIAIIIILNVYNIIVYG